MSHNKAQNCWNLLINAYILDAFGEYIPNIVVHKIILFYKSKNNECFNIYHYSGDKWNKINKDGINNVIDMYTNGVSQFYVTNDNKFYFNGITSAYRDNAGTMLDGDFDHIAYFDHIDIKLVSEARESGHLIIHADNILCGAGDNRYGQLLPVGNNNFKARFLEAIIICDNVNNRFKSEIIQIESGLKHTLFLTQNGNVYGSGSNFDGQLSLDKESDHYEITLLNEFSNIISVRCEMKSSYVLDRFGKVAGFGDVLKRHPDINAKLAKYDVMSINTGAENGCFITKRYELYMFGGNDFNQCGTVYPKEIKKPLKFEFNEVIIEIQCGGYHNIIETNNNKYYGFGRNDKKQCSFGLNGNENSDSFDKPQYISLKKLKENIGNNNDIIGFKPSFLDTYVIQLN